MWCAGGGASGRVGGLTWWVCEKGGVMSPGGGSPGRRGPGVSAAASVWAVGDRDVAASRVLCADAVGG